MMHTELAGKRLLLMAGCQGRILGTAGRTCPSRPAAFKSQDAWMMSAREAVARCTDFIPLAPGTHSNFERQNELHNILLSSQEQAAETNPALSLRWLPDSCGA